MVYDIKYSIGYNFDFEGFFNVISKYKNYIESVYFPLPKKIIGAGRILDEPIAYEKEIHSIIKKCRELEIAPFLLLNSTIVSPSQIEKIVNHLETLYKKHGLRHVTVTDPYLIIQIKKSFPDIYIEASTLCRVKTVEEAKYFKDIGASRITSDREIIRDLKSLKKIQKILPIKVLANEGCIKNCIYKYSHYNMLSLDLREEPFIPFGKKFQKRKEMFDEMDSMCVISISKNPYKVFSSPFIRPEDIKKYVDVTDIFKLSTRNFDSKRIEKTLVAYINQKYSGNLIDLLNTSYIQRIFSYIDNDALNSVKFFEKLSTCDDNCDKCNFCKDLMKYTKIL